MTVEIYQIVKYQGRLKQLINHPYEDDEGQLIVGIREPGDPTTFETVSIVHLDVVVGICLNCDTIQIFLASDEYDKTHVTCQDCGEEYHARHNNHGGFLHFANEADQALEFRT